MKRLMLAAGLSAAAFAAVATPSVEGVSYTQAADGVVTISYTLAGEDAIVTFDAQAGGTALGGEALRDVTSASACWKVVQPGAHTIVWRPHAALANGAGAVSIGVSAWATDNPPPVMVVDLQAATVAADRVRYYPTVDHLPGGLFENAAYRTSKLVFKKVMGAGVNFQMGAPKSLLPTLPAAEEAYEATLARNYFLGIFEFTQGQYAQFSTSFPSRFCTNRAMRPLELLTFNEVRCAAIGQTAYAGSGAFADAPYAGSLLNLIRTRTGVAVDLPTEAEWDYAAKAGGDGAHWDNGALIVKVDNDPNANARHKFNGGYIDGTTVPPNTADVEFGTAIVGSYAPNAWGFYDMHGNLFEFCLDWYESDASSYRGAVNIDPNDPTKTRSGATGGNRVRRGGAWHTGAWDARPSNRLGCTPSQRAEQWGFRLLVPAGTATTDGPAVRVTSEAAALASVGGTDTSSAASLEARILTWLMSEAIGIKAVPLRGMMLLFR